jgi:uncharacterized MAPEG superfamily protein
MHEMPPSLYAVVVYAAWTLLLSVAIVGFRGVLMQTQRRLINSFPMDKPHPGPDIYHRLLRAQANACENLPIFASLMLAASLSGQGAVSDGYAMMIFYLRVGQTIAHLGSVNNVIIYIRFGFFFAQIALLLMIAARLLLG